LLRGDEILMRIRSLPAAAAVLIPLVLAAPVAGARADTTPTAPVPGAAAPPLFTFVPPRVGPISVSIAPTFINGQLISPGVNVSTPGTSLPPITWSPPA
jgi:hypothetical protein